MSDRWVNVYALPDGRIWHSLPRRKRHLAEWASSHHVGSDSFKLLYRIRIIPKR